MLYRKSKKVNTRGNFFHIIFLLCFANIFQHVFLTPPLITLHPFAMYL